MHGKEPAYETGGGLSASCCGGNGWNRTNTFSSSASRADYLHHVPKNNWQVLRDSHPPGRFWRPTRPLEHLGPIWCPRPVARRLPLFGRQPCICEHISGESLVEQDGYAPSPPHCNCGVLLLSLRPRNGHDGGTCTRDPRLCRPVPWLLGHVVIEIEPRLRSLGVRRLLSRPSSVTAD